MGTDDKPGLLVTVRAEVYDLVFEVTGESNCGGTVPISVVVFKNKMFVELETKA